MFPLNADDKWIFPMNIGTNSDKMIAWIPDFQEKHLPQLFSKQEMKKRDDIIRYTCKRKIPIVFSSYNSQSDFRKFYSEFADHPTFVVHFAVNQRDFSDVNITILKNKYGIQMLRGVTEEKNSLLSFVMPTGNPHSMSPKD